MTSPQASTGGTWPGSAAAERDWMLPAGGDGQAPRRRGRRHQPTSQLDWLLFVLLLGAAGWLAWHSVALIRADFQQMRARSMVISWADGRAAWTIPDWVYARDALRAAAKTTPENAAIQDQLGILYGVRARDAGTRGVQLIYHGEALKHQKASVALRPRHGWAWAALAQTLNAIAPADPEVWAAWRKAYAYAPHETAVQITLLAVGLHSWAVAPADIKQAMKAIDATAVSMVRTRTDALAKSLRLSGWRQAAP